MSETVNESEVVQLRLSELTLKWITAAMTQARRHSARQDSDVDIEPALEQLDEFGAALVDSPSKIESETTDPSLPKIMLSTGEFRYTVNIPKPVVDQTIDALADLQMEADLSDEPGKFTILRKVLDNWRMLDVSTDL